MRRLYVVGLRNHDQLYSGTRHNIGAAVVNELARRHSLTWTTKGDSDQAEWSAYSSVLVLPRTFMNLSGRPVAKVFAKKEDAAHHLLVVHDELELKLGQVKIKAGGSARGHNGIKSIVDCLAGLNTFPRVLVGIDRPASRDAKAVSSHVLTKFHKADQEALTNALHLACDAIEKHVAQWQAKATPL
jgi:PTH1 family peptidyl-tRNA hydrolase